MQRLEKKQKKAAKLVSLNFEYIAELSLGDLESYSDELLTIANELLVPKYAGSFMAPGRYKLTDDLELLLQCHLAIRQDEYGVMKIDLVSPTTTIAHVKRSWVAPVLTLVKSLDGVNLIIKNKMNHRLAKIISREFTSEIYTDKLAELGWKKFSGKVSKAMLAEVENWRSLRQLKPRGPYYQISDGPSYRVTGMFTMERIPGSDFVSLIKYTNGLSITDFLDIKLQSFYGLLTQVHGRGKIHNDIKPENMLTNKSAGHTRVWYVDGEFVRDQHDHRYQYMIGTTTYLAPEMAQKWEFSVKSDIYQLGLVLRSLLGDHAFLFDHSKMTDEQVLAERARAKWGRAYHFPARSDISLELYQQIISVLMSMTEIEASARYSLDECIEITESIYLAHLTSGAIDKNEKMRITNAFYTATLFSEKSRKYCMTSLLSAERLSQFKRKLKTNLAGLPDDLKSVAEFCARQDEMCLKGLSRVAELHDKIDQVIDAFQVECTLWDALRVELQSRQNNGESLRCHAIFTQKINETPRHLDAFIKQTEHIQTKIAKMREQFLKEVTSVSESLDNSSSELRHAGM